MAAPVVHFEIHATDRPALARFYEEVFGWATQSAPQMPYTLLYPNGKARQDRDEELAGPGIAGGMMDRRGPAPEKGAPVNGFTCVIQVEDLDATKEAILAHGGETALEPMDIEGVGRVYYFHDPSGNIVCAMQPVTS